MISRDNKITKVTKRLLKIFSLALVTVFLVGVGGMFAQDTVTICSAKYMERLEKRHENVINIKENAVELASQWHK